MIYAYSVLGRVLPWARRGGASATVRGTWFLLGELACLWAPVRLRSWRLADGIEEGTWCRS